MTVEEVKTVWRKIILLLSIALFIIQIGAANVAEANYLPATCPVFNYPLIEDIKAGLDGKNRIIYSITTSYATRIDVNACYQTNCSSKTYDISGSNEHYQISDTANVVVGNYHSNSQFKLSVKIYDRHGEVIHNYEYTVAAPKIDGTPDDAILLAVKHEKSGNSEYTGACYKTSNNNHIVMHMANDRDGTWDDGLYIWKISGTNSGYSAKCFYHHMWGPDGVWEHKCIQPGWVLDEDHNVALLYYCNRSSLISGRADSWRFLMTPNEHDFTIKIIHPYYSSYYLMLFGTNISLINLGRMNNTQRVYTLHNVNTFGTINFAVSDRNTTNLNTVKQYHKFILSKPVRIGNGGMVTLPRGIKITNDGTNRVKLEESTKTHLSEYWWWFKHPVVDTNTGKVLIWWQSEGPYYDWKKYRYPWKTINITPGHKYCIDGDRAGYRYILNNKLFGIYVDEYHPYIEVKGKTCFVYHDY